MTFFCLEKQTHILTCYGHTCFCDLFCLFPFFSRRATGKSLLLSVPKKSWLSLHLLLTLAKCALDCNFFYLLQYLWHFSEWEGKNLFILIFSLLNIQNQSCFYESELKTTWELLWTYIRVGGMSVSELSVSGDICQLWQAFSSGKRKSCISTLIADWSWSCSCKKSLCLVVLG